MVRRPTETYAPWFYMVLKAARVAVTILQMLANEVRSAAPDHLRGLTSPAVT